LAQARLALAPPRGPEAGGAAPRRAWAGSPVRGRGGHLARMGKGNVRVYLDISIGNRTGGRVVIELFSDVTPRTAENFRALCTGEFGQGRTTKKRLCYEGCSIFRSVKGSFLQSGDFQHNNGDGGESIYGGTFADEDFSRRHTQAGVLSMANKGRNTNGSQFFITLKRHPQLDNKHIAFGQVVEGMDIIRAVSQVPVDKDEKPRVSVTIVGSGQVDRKTHSGTSLNDAMSSQIAKLHEDAAPTKVNAAAEGRAVLAGKAGGAEVPEAVDSASKKEAAAKEESEAAVATMPARNERERRLFELRLKMNAGRASNSKEVVEEQKREADPNYSRKKADQNHKRSMEQAAGDGGVGEGEKPGALPKGKDYLNDSIETVEMKASKKKKGNPDAFGWDVFNQDSLYRAHDKRLTHMHHDAKAYEEQQAELAQDNSMLSSMCAGHGHVPSEAGKARLQEATEKMIAHKRNFSRRREHVVDEDCTFVNERNRHFNKKMERAFGAYTQETRQNLERGTAL